MKKLILLRHAKSSWDDPSLDDHDRPLNKRGRTAAQVIGNWLRYRDHNPDFILCSSALRTRQTVDRMRAADSSVPEPRIEPELYHAAPDAIVAVLAELPADCRTAMIVGHQPGLGSLARMLADGTENRRCRRAYEHFPTAAAAVLEADINSWREVAFRSMRFIDFAKPRELIDA